jgi:hypothetical protein
MRDAHQSALVAFIAFLVSTASADAATRIQITSVRVRNRLSPFWSEKGLAWRHRPVQPVQVRTMREAAMVRNVFLTLTFLSV